VDSEYPSGSNRDAGTGHLRRSLARLRRAVEKAASELDVAASAVRDAGAGAAPAAGFDDAAQQLADVLAFIDEEEQRLQQDILRAAGIEPARVRRQP
jgi:hypothetical protein